MTLYSVFDRRLDEAPAVVPDRFSWFAALLPPVYAIAHGLWLGLVGYLLGVVVISVAGLWLGPDAGFWLYVLFAVLIGWEAPGLRRRALRRSGYVYRTERIAAAADLAQVDWIRRRGSA
jgi:hypothetical protein